MSDILDALWKERNDLRARVKELEKERDAAEAELWGANYFTNEMIDEAVEVIQPFTKNYEDSGWPALNKLGIHRCEGCGGSGRFEAVGLYEDCEDCAPWGSKGWVIGQIQPCSDEELLDRLDDI